MFFQNSNEEFNLSDEFKKFIDKSIVGMYSELKPFLVEHESHKNLLSRFQRNKAEMARAPAGLVKQFTALMGKVQLPVANDEGVHELETMTQSYFNEMCSPQLRRIEALKKIKQGQPISLDEHRLLMQMKVFSERVEIKQYPRIQESGGKLATDDDESQAGAASTPGFK